MEQLSLLIFLTSCNLLLLQTSHGCYSVAEPERIKVEEELTSWRHDVPSYHPPFWTAPCLFKHCDPEMNASFTFAMRFNHKDRGVDRRLVRRMNRVKAQYNVSGGLPLNPLGRTGLAGRGRLPRWGPTHLVKVILLKRRHVNMAYLKARDELPFKDDAFATVVDNLKSSKLSDRVISAVRNSSRFRYRSYEADWALQEAEENAIKVAADTMPSPLDTDNAWIELSVYVIHCKLCKSFCKALMEDADIRANYEWSDKTDNQTFFDKLRTLRRLDEEAMAVMANRQNRKTTFRRFVHSPYQRGYRRETAFAVGLLGLYGIGAGLFIAGLLYAGIGVVVAASIIGLIVGLIGFAIRCYQPY